MHGTKVLAGHDNLFAFENEAIFGAAGCEVRTSSIPSFLSTPYALWLAFLEISRNANLESAKAFETK